MKILAIETSCDDTCISIIQTKNKKSNINFEIISNIVSSQIKLHAKYGGVYPALAKREHQHNLLPVLVQALKQSKLLKISNFKFLISKQSNPPGSRQGRQQNSNFQIPKPNIDLIAVTIGPGLEPCLWVGLNFAKELSKNWKKPLIPVNHIEAHIFANWFSPSRRGVRPRYKLVAGSDPAFPAICLIVSGGHTQLILMKEIGKYKILGETRDDAAGECFDKTARILGLPYPGGPAIAEQATQSCGGPASATLPRPMIYQKNYDFSFSGLKTAVLYDYKKRSSKEKKSKAYIQKMSSEIQQAIIDVLIYKTIKAAKDYKAKTIILGGGVAANDELRKQLKLKLAEAGPPQVLVPSKNLCTDNAVMIGITAYFLWLKNKSKNWKNIKVNANLRVENEY